MDRVNTEGNTFSICGRCPLNNKLQGQNRIYRVAAGETVRRIGEEIEAMTSRGSLYGEAPAFVQEVSQSYGTEELAEQAWYCSRIRRLGTCSSVQVIFADPKYL